MVVIPTPFLRSTMIKYRDVVRFMHCCLSFFGFTCLDQDLALGLGFRVRVRVRVRV
jgi:hypothetical protein